MDETELLMDCGLKGIVKNIDGEYQIMINSMLKKEERELVYNFLYHEIALGNI